MLVTGARAQGTSGNISGTVADATGAVIANAAVNVLSPISGYTQTTQYDFVRVTGNATLAGTLSVSMLNNFQSVVTNGASFVVLSNATAFAGAFANVASGGTLTFTNAGLLSSNRSFLLDRGGGVFNTIGASPVAIAGAVTGNGALTKTGGGVLVLAGANSYTGPTSIGGGVLRAAGTNVFGTTGSLLVGAGASADLGGFDQTVGSIGGSGSILLGDGLVKIG